MMDSNGKMSTLQHRLNNERYKNWIKAGLCLSFLKEGLEEFADLKSKDFHRNVLSDISNSNITAAVNSVCRTERMVFKRNKATIACHHPFCQGFLNAVIQEGIDPNQNFTIGQSNVANCNVQLWHKDPWELAKLFMNPGQKSTQAKPRDTDLSGILNFLDHCRVPRDDVTNAQFIHMVRDARNTIMHSSTMEVSQNDLQCFSQSMINLLEDRRVLASMSSAQHAAEEIRKVLNANFKITDEFENKVLENLVSEYHNLTEGIKTSLQELRRNLSNVMESEENERANLKDELLKQINQQEEETNQIRCSVQILKKVVQNDKALLLQLDCKVRELQDSFELYKDEIKELKTHMHCIDSRLRTLETKDEITTSVLHELQADIHTDFSSLRYQIDDIETRIGNVEENSRDEKDFIKLQRLLMDEYQRMYFEVPLSPIYEGLNDDLMKVPIDEIYTDVDINNQKEGEKTLLDSYNELFFDNNKKNKYVFIKGEVGVGKSTWCRRMLHAWCETREEALAGRDTSLTYTEKSCSYRKMKEALSQFEYLFFIPLRYVGSQCAVKDILPSFSMEALSDLNEVFHRVLEEHSGKVLFLLDGLDEFPFLLDFHGLNQSTVIVTTRPWKYDSICSSSTSFKIDMVLTINGLNDKGIIKLTENVMLAFHRNRLKRTCHSDRDSTIQAEACLQDIRRVGLQDSVKIPLVLIFITLSWLENHQSLSKSLTCNILNLLNVMFMRGEEKLSEAELNSFKDTQPHSETYANQALVDSESDYLYSCQESLQMVGTLAFQGLTSTNRTESLVFTEQQLKRQLTPEKLEVFYKLGILSRSIVAFSLIARKKVFVSFYHKLIQEFLAAFWIVNNSQALRQFKLAVNSLETMFEMENVILFICGLCPTIGSDISKHFVSVFDNTDYIQYYRERSDRFKTWNMYIGGPVPINRYTELLMKCMAEISIVPDQEIRLYMSDIVLFCTPDAEKICAFNDKRLNILINNNRKELKSLFLKEAHNLTTNQLSKLALKVSSSTALQKLIIEVEKDVCADEQETSEICFDFSRCSNLETLNLSFPPGLVSCKPSARLNAFYLHNVRIYGLAVPAKMKTSDVHFQSVAMSETSEKAIVYIQRCDINTSFLSKNHGVLKSVTMPKYSWENFFQSLLSEELNIIDIHNLDMDEMIISLEHCSQLEQLKLEGCKVAGITLPKSTTNLKSVALKTVAIQRASWICFFRSLESAENLTSLELEHLDIDENIICLKNSSKLRRLDLRNLDICQLILPPSFTIQEAQIQNVRMAQLGDLFYAEEAYTGKYKYS